MSMKDSLLKTAVEEDKINSHYSQLLAQHRKPEAHPNKNVMQDQAHEKPPAAGHTPEGPFGNKRMHYSKLLQYLEAAGAELAAIEQEEEDDLSTAPMGMPPEQSTSLDHTDLLDELNQLFTPVLIMQGFENDIADQAESNFAEAALLTEKNTIKFDDSTRMAQLIAVCARLLGRKKQTDLWKTFEKASMVARQADLDMQRAEYDEAKILAQQYLVKVSTTNNSSVARKAASDLLPLTQH